MSYEPVPTEDGDAKSQTQQDNKPDSVGAGLARVQQFFSFTRYFIAATALLAIILTVFYLPRDARTRANDDSHLELAPESCGSSATEAVSRGCVFDVMEFAWVPSRCFDGELLEDFLALRDWEWYLDAAATEAADKDAVAQGRHDEVFVTQQYHIYHCTYMWRKMHRAFLAGDVLDGYIADTHHTAHCELQLANYWRSGINDTGTSIYVKYSDCPASRQAQDLGRFGWYRMIGGQRVHRNP
ncbi:hypothetical protein G647_02746 [Cladophialophora carrionii CBS 160.54]|uniref:Uncharacterized protein n=1 Tax=Cladophialophora carrionii CBS 160.54 TaxID=1279043 RepID=V9DGF5_9EURO|nr:uncharacterized protein G647_02746 [Cladophialophora carrionii CBS 160.54]ETI25969.1 hypothetical protein G647_02746 [Cladophialophora carrionii CBS 160.54]